jgi:hypothetical protein
MQNFDPSIIDFFENKGIPLEIIKYIGNYLEFKKYKRNFKCMTMNRIMIHKKKILNDDYCSDFDNEFVNLHQNS